MIVIILQVYVQLDEQLKRFKSNSYFREIIYPFVRIASLGCFVVAWGLLVSSFLVGMIKRVGLGLKILGYGAAIIGGVVVLPGSCALLMWKLVNDSRKKKEKGAQG
jgi:hypothetical protein